MIAVPASPSAVLDHDPGVRLAGPARPQQGIQGRGDHGAAARGDGAPSADHPAQAGLGRTRGPGGTGPAAAALAAGKSAGYAGNAAGLASSADHPKVDLPEPARPPAD